MGDEGKADQKILNLFKRIEKMKLTEEDGRYDKKVYYLCCVSYLWLHKN